MRLALGRGLWPALLFGGVVAASCSLRDLDRYMLNGPIESAGAAGSEQPAGSGGEPEEAGPETTPDVVRVDAEPGQDVTDVLDVLVADEDAGLPTCPARGAPVCANPLSRGSFPFSEYVCDSLPQSIEGWVEAACSGQFESHCPDGYVRTGCTPGAKGSHHGCSVCLMSKYVCECVAPGAEDAGDGAAEAAAGD